MEHRELTPQKIHAMIKIYLKQAWELMKQNKLFSTLYVVGTGLAIAMTMIMAIIYYVKIAPVYPEVNRMNTLYLDNSKFVKGPKGNQQIIQIGRASCRDRV